MNNKGLQSCPIREKRSGGIPAENGSLAAGGAGGCDSITPVGNGGPGGSEGPPGDSGVRPPVKRNSGFLGSPRPMGAYNGGGPVVMPLFPSATSCPANPDPIGTPVCGYGYSGGTPTAGMAPGYASQNVTCAMTVGGSARCLSGETPVRLWPEGCKVVGELEPGDTLVGPGPDGFMRPQTVQKDISSVTQRCLEIIYEGGSFVSSATHKVALSTGEYSAVADLLVGKHELLGEDGKPVKLLQIKDAGLHQVFAFNCEPDHLFVSQGIVHHNIKTQG